MATTQAPPQHKLLPAPGSLYKSQQETTSQEQHAVYDLSGGCQTHSSHASTLCCQRQDATGECSSPYRLPQPVLQAAAHTPEVKAKHHSLMDILVAVEMVEQGLHCSPVHAASPPNQQQQQEQKAQLAQVDSELVPACAPTSGAPATADNSNKRQATAVSAGLIEDGATEEGWAHVRAPFEVYVPRAKRTKRSSSGSTQSEERRLGPTVGSAASDGLAPRHSIFLDTPSGPEITGVMPSRGSADGSHGAALPPLPPRQFCKPRAPHPASTHVDVDMQLVPVSKPAASCGNCLDQQLPILSTPVTIGSRLPDADVAQGASLSSGGDGRATRSAAQRAGQRWRTATALTGELHSMHSDPSGNRRAPTVAASRSQQPGHQSSDGQRCKAGTRAGPCEQVYSRERLLAWLHGRERMSAIETGELLNATRALTAKVEQMQREMHAQLNALMWDANRADVQLAMPDILLPLCQTPSMLHASPCAPSSSVFGGMTALPRNSSGPSMTAGPMSAPTMVAGLPVMQPYPGMQAAYSSCSLLPGHQQQMPATDMLPQQQQQQPSPLNQAQAPLALSFQHQCTQHAAPMRASTAGAMPGRSSSVSPSPGVLLPSMPTFNLPSLELNGHGVHSAGMQSCSMQVLPSPAAVQNAGMHGMCNAPFSSSKQNASCNAPILSLQGAGGHSMQSLLPGAMPPLPHLPSLLHPAPHANASTTTLRLQPLPSQPMWKPHGLPFNKQQQPRSNSTSPDSNAENMHSRPAAGSVRMPATLSLDSVDAVCCSTLPTPPGLLLTTPQQGVRYSGMHCPQQLGSLPTMASMQPAGVLPPIPSLRVSPSPMDLFASQNALCLAPGVQNFGHAFNASASLPVMGAAALAPNLAGDSVCVLKVGVGHASGASKLMEASESTPGLILGHSIHR